MEPELYPARRYITPEFDETILKSKKYRKMTCRKTKYPSKKTMDNYSIVVAERKVRGKKNGLQKLNRCFFVKNIWGFKKRLYFCAV